MHKSTIFLLIIFSSYSYSDIQYWRDEKGGMHYSDQLPLVEERQKIKNEELIYLPKIKDNLFENLSKNYCSWQYENNFSFFLEKFESFQTCLATMLNINRVCYEIIINDYPNETLHTSRFEDFYSEMVKCSMLKALVK